MLDGIVIFFFSLNYRLLGHAKINISKFMFYFSRNLRGEKKGKIEFFFYILKKKSYVILFLVLHIIRMSYCLKLKSWLSKFHGCSTALRIARVMTMSKNILNLIVISTYFSMMVTVPQESSSFFPPSACFIN